MYAVDVARCEVPNAVARVLGIDRAVMYALQLCQKEDVRKMPDLNVKTNFVNIDQDKFSKSYFAKLSGYKNPDLRVLPIGNCK